MRAASAAASVPRWSQSSPAAVYALAWPGLAAALLPAAVLVGFSRVRLGVHYPGDVLVGQLIAIATALIVAR